MKRAGYFMKIAHVVAEGSEDLSTHVGCVIVGEDREILTTGYTGRPRGVRALPERLERPAKYLYTSHAEVSAIGNAARSGVSLRGSTAYVTHFPCDDCARLLIQSGVHTVHVGSGTTSMPSEKFEAAKIMFLEAGVSVYVQNVPMALG
jgi:dCMP deaminase